MSSSHSAKTELESVVNWPLLVSGATVAALGLAVPLGLAFIAALRGDPVKEPVAVRPAPVPAPHAIPQTPAVKSNRPSETPQPAKSTQPRQVYLPAVPPPIPPDPKPAPVVVRKPPQSPPALNPVLQAPPETKAIFKRLDEMPESALLLHLTERAKDVDLDRVKGSRDKLLEMAQKNKEKKRPAILVLRDERGDLKGLPLREGADCQAKPEAAKIMQDISTTLRRTLGREARRQSLDQSIDIRRAQELHKMFQASRTWFHDEGLSTLAQMLQVEALGCRCQLIQRLDRTEGDKSSEVLARIALFDVSWPVRVEAIKALQKRPHAEYRPVLLEGLRYPFGPVAAHAAEALAAVNDRTAVYRLVDLLDQPDPCLPVRDKDDKWSVPELVRINHLGNCLLCHAPSTEPSDPLRVPVPTRGQPLPQVYYSSRQRDGIFVRADITYLRQDFSLIELVEKPDKWPQWQRFDYVVRRHELTADELAAYKKKLRQPDWASYPQREAVLFALRELTGANPGSSSAAWRKRLGLIAEPSP